MLFPYMYICVLFFHSLVSEHLDGISLPAAAKSTAVDMGTQTI